MPAAAPMRDILLLMWTLWLCGHRQAGQDYHGFFSLSRIVFPLQQVPLSDVASILMTDILHWQ